MINLDISIRWEDLTPKKQEQIVEFLASEMKVDVYGKDNQLYAFVENKAKQSFPVDTFIYE